MAVEGPSLKLNPIIPQKGGKQRGNNRSIRYPKLPPRCTFAGRICVTRHGGQRLQKAKEIADKLESIADDGIVDHMERADFDTALAFLRSLEETITDMLLWAMSRETEKSRPAATETALVK